MPTTVDAVETMLARAKSLYTLPTVAARILALTQAPQIDLRAIRECLEQDPALTAKILRVVNSSLFGLTRGVSDLGQAIAVLGLNPLKMLVLGFSLPDRLFMSLHGDVLRRYWRRSLLKAVFSRELARLKGLPQSEEIFLAGLLSEIGILLLIQEYGTAYTQFLNTALSSANELSGWEEQALGLDHAELGAVLLQDWNLPERVVRWVRAGTVVSRICTLTRADQSVANTLLLADRLAWSLAENRQDLWTEIFELSKAVGLRNDQLQTLAGIAETQVTQLGEALSLALEPSESYEYLTQQALLQCSELLTQQVASNLRAKQLVDPQHSQLTTATAELRRAVEQREQITDDIAKQKVERVEAWPTVNLAAETKEVFRAQPETLVKETLSRFPVLKPAVPHVEPALRDSCATLCLQCRQARIPLSLVMVVVDPVLQDQSPATQPSSANQLTNELWNQVRASHWPGLMPLRVGQQTIAVLLPDCERRAALQMTQEWQRNWSKFNSSYGSLPTTLSIGVATVSLPTRNFPSENLIVAAQRCLDAAQLSGGNACKSIEVG
jgi:HD-like signal output (HDOD) protein/GGDEF domain-containing protein